jgi:hypothetical protein
LNSGTAMHCHGSTSLRSPRCRARRCGSAAFDSWIASDLFHFDYLRRDGSRRGLHCGPRSFYDAVKSQRWRRTMLAAENGEECLSYSAPCLDVALIPTFSPMIISLMTVWPSRSMKLKQHCERHCPMSDISGLSGWPDIALPAGLPQSLNVMVVIFGSRPWWSLAGKSFENLRRHDRDGQF